MNIINPSPILIAEDDMIDLENILRSFKENKITHPLFTAKDGFEALCRLQGLNGMPRLFPTPNILLLDINMPRMNGIELLHHLRQDPLLCNLHVFMLTTSDSERDISLSRQYDIEGYIVKPTLLSDFTKSMNCLIQGLVAKDFYEPVTAKIT